MDASWRPDVRQWFIPDIGNTMFDADLAQADAQIVAWEADDEELKAIFRDPNADLHDENALAIFGKITPHGRQMAKAGVHATNYGAKPRTLARSLGITVAVATAFQRKWFSAHPKIKDWQDRVELSLQTTRSVSNAFGFKIRYFGRVDSILPEALAWIPQSSVAHIINVGLNRLEAHPIIIPNIQVHDSVVGQFPHSFYPNRSQIRDALEVIVPYPDPLTIGVDITCSRKSWGDCKPVPWENSAAYCPY